MLQTLAYFMWNAVNLGARVKLSKVNNSENMEYNFPKRLKIIQSPTQMLTETS